MSFSAPRRLADSDCMEGFTCGVPAIDGWLSKHARSSFKRGTAVVYVSFDELGRLAGFYTLSAHSIDRGSISGWLARNSPEQVPTILLGMLGVSVDHKREGLGKQLLLDAYHRARLSAETIGARALVVDPLDEARGFYQGFGFEQVAGSDKLFARF